MSVPHRSREQRDAALERANEVRTARADLKDRVHADPSWRDLIALVEGAAGGELAAVADRARLEAMQVTDVLAAAAGIGKGRAGALIAEVDPSLRGRANVTLSRLGPSRRARLAYKLEEVRRRRSDSALERTAARGRNYSVTKRRRELRPAA